MPPDILKVNSSSSTSLANKSRVVNPASSNDKLDIDDKTGASFTPSTVKVNCLESLSESSKTLTVIISEPLKLSIGINVNVEPLITSWIYSL